MLSSLVPRPLPDFISQPFFHGCAIKSGSGLGTRLSDVRRITTHMGLLSYCTEFTILSTGHRNETRQWSLAAYSGFAMQLINHLIYRCVFSTPKNGHISLGLDITLHMPACCMKPGCSEMIQSVSSGGSRILERGVPVRD